MQRNIPEIKIQTPKQVDASLRKKGGKDESLADISPPREFYEANGEMTNRSLYFTAMEDVESLDNEDEPPYIDLDKDLKLPNSFKDSPNHPMTPSSFLQSPFTFTTPQASSTKRDIESLSSDMSTINIDLTAIEDLVADPYFSSNLSGILEGGETLDDSSELTKHSLIELFDEYCKHEQDKYRKQMQSTTNSEDSQAKIDLETLDYETTFVDLSAETSELPPNVVTNAVNYLTRAEIKNEIYQAMVKDQSSTDFEYETETKSSNFDPDTRGNIEILTYIGTTGPNKSSSFKSEVLEESNFESSQENSVPVMSRWDNISNLAFSP